MTHSSRALLALASLLLGCGGWTARTPGFTYPRTSGDVPVHADRIPAAVHPEAYAIGHGTRQGRDLDAVAQQLAALGKARGAHVVLLDRQEATVSSWTTVRTADGQGGSETGRKESVSVDSAEVVGRGTGYRVPKLCVGALLVCEPIPAPIDDGATCEVRVRRLVPGAPFAEAGVREGQVVTHVDGVPVRSPSDVFARADRGGELELLVRGELGPSAVQASPSACAQVYPNAASPGGDPSGR